MEVAAPDFFLHQSFCFSLELHRHISNLAASAVWRKFGLVPGLDRCANLRVGPPYYIDAPPPGSVVHSRRLYHLGRAARSKAVQGLRYGRGTRRIPSSA